MSRGRPSLCDIPPSGILSRSLHEDEVRCCSVSPPPCKMPQRHRPCLLKCTKYCCPERGSLCDNLRVSRFCLGKISKAQETRPKPLLFLFLFQRIHSQREARSSLAIHCWLSHITLAPHMNGNLRSEHRFLLLPVTLQIFHYFPIT